MLITAETKPGQGTRSSWYSDVGVTPAVRCPFPRQSCVVLLGETEADRDWRGLHKVMGLVSDRPSAPSSCLSPWLNVECLTPGQELGGPRLAAESLPGLRPPLGAPD